MALIVKQFDCTRLVQKDITRFNSSQKDKVMKLHLTGFAFHHDIAVAAAALGILYTRHFSA